MKKKNDQKDFLSPAPDGYKWPRCPEADGYVQTRLAAFLARHGFAARLAEGMKRDASAPFPVWVDHLRLPSADRDEKDLARCGFVEDKKTPRPTGSRLYLHPFADLPGLLFSARTRTLGCAIMVEDLWRFQAAHGLSLPIDGEPYSTCRSMRMADGPSDLLVIERRGSQRLTPDTRNRAGLYLRHFERWVTRRRHFDTSAAGMKHTLDLARDTARALGTGPAAAIFLETERLFWESRNFAARVQRGRQDALGLGWGNHDHHTFRSSRAQFPMLIQVLLALGFKKRERYYAGNGAGWGAQILEQPDAGFIIFADVDLAPGDESVDFSKFVMPEIPKPRTVGLWCALHGDSILESGMHHLEAQFDFDLLKEDLKRRDVETMPPFSDFPFLRQAFTKAEMWSVPTARIEALVASGWLAPDAAEQIRAKGAVGSHLENLQRRDGFKGFNQKGVSDIITAVNPEKQAMAPERGH